MRNTAHAATAPLRWAWGECVLAVLGAEARIAARQADSSPAAEYFDIAQGAAPVQLDYSDFLPISNHLANPSAA